MKKERAVFDIALMIVTMLIVSLSLETGSDRRVRESYSPTDLINHYSKSGGNLTAGESVESARSISTSCYLSRIIYKESSDNLGDICSPAVEISRQIVNNGITPIILIENYKPKIPNPLMYKIPRGTYAGNNAARHRSVSFSISPEPGFVHQTGSFYLRV